MLFVQVKPANQKVAACMVSSKRQHLLLSPMYSKTLGKGHATLAPPASIPVTPTGAEELEAPAKSSVEDGRQLHK